MLRAYAIVAAVLMAALLGGAMYFVFIGRSEDAFAQCRAGAPLGGGALGGPFTLVDGAGRMVTQDDILTTPALLYFGYTFCPDVCPLDNVRNAEAVDLLEGMGHQVTPVFISIDPQRDTPQVMAEYVDIMHPRMIGLTGTPEQVRAAAQAYRVYFNLREETAEEDFYMVDHTTLTYLVLPGHGFVDTFRRETTPEEMAQRTACFLEAM